jgi:hypothetical protein
MKVIDNPKPWLKQKQSKRGTKWIQYNLFLKKKRHPIFTTKLTIQETSSKNVDIRCHNKRLQ